MNTACVRQDITYGTKSHTWQITTHVGCVGTVVNFFTKPTRKQLRDILRFCKQGTWGETLKEFLSRKK